MSHKVAITGASGFLGRYLIDAVLADTSLSIVPLYNQHLPKQNLPHERIEWLQCDLLDVASLEDCLDGCDYIIHAAAIVSFEPSEKAKMLRFNTESTANVVELARLATCKKLVHISSISALQKLNSDCIDESLQDVQNYTFTNYGTSKYLAEQEVWRGIAEGVDAVILSPSLILGSGDWSQGSPRMIKTVADGLPYYPTGSTGFVYAQDVAKMAVQLLLSPLQNQRIICNSENRTYQSVIVAVAKCLDVRPPSKPITKFHIRLVGIVARIRRLLGMSSILTKESLTSSNSDACYDNSRSLQLLNYTYTPIDMAIAKICVEYKKTGA